VVVARGGRGGRGNTSFRSSVNQAPKIAERGLPGEELWLTLELKLIADVGIIGVPNAGKSTLLSVVSAARPKIADYPFTTLQPNLGVVVLDHRDLVMADIPGLIEGAHDGAGLGHDFLRHIERSSILIYVIDMAGTDGRVPNEDYASLRKELELHSVELLRRPALVVANKMDIPEAAANLKTFRRKTRTRPICVSAATGEGVAELKLAIHEAYRQLPQSARKTV
jgi:GTP-binding protein